MNICTKCRGKKRGGLKCAWGSKKRYLWSRNERTGVQNLSFLREDWAHTKHRSFGLAFHIILPPVVHLKNVMAAILLTRFHWIPYVILPQYGLESWPIPVAGQQRFRTWTLEAESLWVWILLLPLGGCVTQTSSVLHSLMYEVMIVTISPHRGVPQSQWYSTYGALK